MTPPRSSGAARTLVETRLIFLRAKRLSLRNPVWVIIGLIQPLLYLALFGPLLERVASAPGFPPGDAWQVFVPGLLVQLGIFGAAFVGFGLIAELRAGVVERMRVTPASRLALLLGRVMREVVVLVVQAILLVVAATAFGLRAPLWGIVFGLAFVALLGAAFSSASYAAALTLKSEDALAPLLNGLAVPILLLSGILLPMSLAPGWLSTLADVNPVQHVVEALRALFRGQVATGAVMWARSRPPGSSPPASRSRPKRSSGSLRERGRHRIELLRVACQPWLGVRGCAESMMSRAIAFDSHGGLMCCGPSTDPPQRGQIRVQVRAAGVQSFDYLLPAAQALECG